MGEPLEIVVVPKDAMRPISLFVQYLGDPERYERVWDGGFRVGPSEVENILMEHEAVLECAVIGIPDPLRGQAIRAVVLNPGYEAGKDMEKTLREFSNARRAEYKWIRVIEFTDRIPKTISNKICKAALRQ